MKYFDSHAHYWDSRFSENSESADALIGALLSESVSGIVNVGTDPKTSRIALEQANRYANVYATAGIHPSDTRFLSDLDADLSEIEQLIRSNRGKVVALGEIGLDYHYEDTDREKQARYFEAQLCLAEALDVPVVIHDREAHGDAMEAVLRHPRVCGVFHSFSGSPEMAKELARRGWMLSACL
jgi:TatD DNase family protein